MRLRSTDGRATAYVYGWDVHAELRFARNSEDKLIPSDWLDDAVHRMLIPDLKELRIWTTDEFTTTDDITEISYATGKGRLPYDVREVTAVYDTDADPQRLTPLDMTWSSVTKIVTLDDEVVTGTRLHVRMSYRPDVAYTGDQEYATNYLPAVLVERATVSRRIPGLGTTRINDTDEGVAYVVRAPDDEDYDLDVVVAALSGGEAMTLLGGLLERYGQGRALTSSATGLTLDARIAERGGSGSRAGFRTETLTMRLHGLLSYMGEEAEGPLALTFTATANATRRAT